MTASVAVALLATWPRTALSIPMLGSDTPELTLEDAWSRTVALKAYRGMPVLFVYEDKDSSTVNQRLKSELAQLAKGDRYKKSVALFAVADVASYDYWPIRGFVKQSIRSESSKMQTTIFCDWDGHVRTTLHLDANTSNVVLFGKNGKVLFAEAGAVSPERGAELLGLLRHEVEGDGAASDQRPDVPAPHQ